MGKKKKVTGDVPSIKKLKVRTYQPENPDEKYIVIVKAPIVVNNTNPREANGRRLQAWLSAMLGKRDGVVESFYTLRTSNYTIVRLTEGLDIIPILGRHRWRDILGVGHGHFLWNETSSIFEYNFKMRGDPNKHQWIEHDVPIPELELFNGIKKPYPRPEWEDITASSLLQIALRLPEDLRPPLLTPQYAVGLDGEPEPQTSGPSDVKVKPEDSYKREHEDVKNVKKEPSTQGPSIAKSEDGIKAETSISQADLDALYGPGAGPISQADLDALYGPGTSENGSTNPQHVKREVGDHDEPSRETVNVKVEASYPTVQPVSKPQRIPEVVTARVKREAEELNNSSSGGLHEGRRQATKRVKTE